MNLRRLFSIMLASTGMAACGWFVATDHPWRALIASVFGSMGITLVGIFSRWEIEQEYLEKWRKESLSLSPPDDHPASTPKKPD